MLRAELISQLGGDPTHFSGLQIVAAPFDALWDNPDYGEWLGFETANNIPLWEAVYQPSVGNWITDAYFAFLTNIDASAQNNDAANLVKALGQQLAAALDGINKAYQQLSDAWKIFNTAQQFLPPELRQSFDDWFGQNWGQTINNLENGFNNLVTQWVAAANQAGGEYTTLGQAMQDYNNPAFQVEAKDTNGIKLSYRTWNLVPRLTDFIQEAQAGQGTSLNLQINARTATSDVTKWGTEGSVSLNQGFVGVGSGDSLTRVTVDTTTQNFVMSFSSKAFTGIKITAGQWFHQNVVLQFQNGPFIASGPFGPGKAVFFGPIGTFNLMASTLYVAYQPSVTATLDSTAYSQVQQGWNTGARIAVGPFSFGSTDNVTFTDTNQTVTMTNNSSHPQLIAVNCTIMPGS